MNKFLLITLTILSTTSLMAKELSCNEIKDREVQINATTKVQVRNLNGVCSLAVETSRDSRKFSYSDKTFKATREWIFHTNGKILIYNSYGTGPTDSSATAYKGYQLFPNDGDLKLLTNSDGTFAISLASGAKVHFQKDGSIDQKKTKELRLKDLPIKVPDIPKEKSSLRYEEIDHLSYNDSRKSSIRVYHRQLNSAATSRSIGLETTYGMYIPLGTAMGLIPGNSTTGEYTLYGIDDKKLCNQRMAAHYFFNYLVKCSSRAPNKRCACKYSEKETQNLLIKNNAYRNEIRDIKWKLKSRSTRNRSQLEARLKEIESIYRPDLYSEIKHNCSLPKSEAEAFVAGKRMSGDNREIDGVEVKKTSDVINALISSNQCKELKKVTEDCVHCFNKELINIDGIENQRRAIEKVVEEL